jgi:hypothetical protein
MATDIDQLVRDVTDLTGAAGPDAFAEDAPVLREPNGSDGFYLVGLIGGKEVGKSALVNALVGKEVTTSTSYGPGTEVVVAYAHVSQAGAVEALLTSAVPGKFRVITHDLAALSRQVLLDLPDVDSHYADHLETTRRMLQHMLYPVWIQSIEKYADQQPQKLLAAVAAGNDPANFVFCLNKVDQLVSADGEEAIDELRADYAKRIARTMKLPQPPQVRMISAINPDEFDLPALREQLSREKSTQLVRRSFELAERQRTRSLLEWLDEQDLPARAQRLKRLEDEAQELTASRLGVTLVEAAIPRLLDDPGHRLAMIDVVMSARVARWPIVNVLHTVLAPLSSLWRRNVGAAAAPTAESLVSAYVDLPDRPLAGSVRATFALMHQSHPAVGALYRENRLWDDLPAENAAADLRESFAAAMQRQRDAVMTRLARRGRVVGAPVRWLLTIGALLWFPFIQPVLEALLPDVMAGQEWDWKWIAPRLAILGVQLLGVTYLLKAVSFLLIWYGVLWLLLRWDTHRKVNRLLLKWRDVGAADAAVNLAAATTEWIDGLLYPIRRARERADALVAHTESLRATVSKSAAA